MNTNETLTRETLLQAEAAARPALVHAYLLAQSADVLRCSPQDLPPNRPLVEPGRQLVHGR